MFIIFPDPPLPLTQNHYLSLPFSQPDAFFSTLSPPCDIENQLYKRDFRYGRKNNKMLIHKKPHLVYVVRYKVLKKDEKKCGFVHKLGNQHSEWTRHRHEKRFSERIAQKKGKNVALLHNILDSCIEIMWRNKKYLLMNYWIWKFIRKKIIDFNWDLFI